jgi:ArsR family transcriptional regulator
MNTLDATLGLLQVLGDPTRVRLLKLLDGEELTVGELAAITQLPQPRVSTHLGRLREAGLVRDRREGTSTWYARADGAAPAPARRLWAALEEEARGGVLESDRARRADVLKARRASEEWPDRVAGQMERHYSPGRTWESLARALLGLLRLGDVLDAGSGDGTIAELIAPHAKSVTCLDRSERLVEAARRRLARFRRARCRQGDLHELPFADRSFDQVLLLHVLTQAANPPRVLAEAARVLRPGGVLVAVTLKAHAHLEITAGYRDVRAGFEPAALARLLRQAGLHVRSCAVTSRERRAPHFEVLTAVAERRKP